MMQQKFDCFKQVTLLLNQVAKLLNDCCIKLFNVAVDLNIAFFLDRCRHRQYDSVASLVASEPELRGTELSAGRAGHMF